MNGALSYFRDGLTLALQELVFLLGPGLLIGLGLHVLAGIIRFSVLRLMSPKAFAWLTAPGTIVHELSHALLCLAFGHEIRDLSLFRPNDKKVLGQVKHAYNPRNPYQMLGHLFIGAAPVWVGAAVLYGLAILLLGGPFFLEAAETDLSWGGLADQLGQIGLSGFHAFQGLFDLSLFQQWQAYVFLYLGISLGAHMTLSLEDFGGAWKGFLALLAMLVLANWMLGWIWDGTEVAVRWLLRPLSMIYGIMVFALLLIAALMLPLALLGLAVGKAGGIKKGE